METKAHLAFCLTHLLEDIRVELLFAVILFLDLLCRHDDLVPGRFVVRVDHQDSSEVNQRRLIVSHVQTGLEYNIHTPVYGEFSFKNNFFIGNRWYFDPQQSVIGHNQVSLKLSYGTYSYSKNMTRACI